MYKKVMLMAKTMAKKKKKLTKEQEFEIMKLVLDKFLWLGVAILGYGLYNLITAANTFRAFSYIIAASIILILFMVLIVREYELKG